jgi:hypothetical protein
VVNTYANGNLVSVTSANTFTPTGSIYSGITSITPGVNLPTTNKLNGTATNSLALGGIVASNYARTDIKPTFTTDVLVNGTVVLTNANVAYTNGTLVLQNIGLYGNIALNVNSGTNQNALTVNGTTGLITVSGDPTNNLGVATKQYVDNSTANVNATISGDIATQNAAIAQLRSDYFANIAVVQSALNSNVSTLQAQTIANTNLLASELASNVSILNSNIATINANLGTVIYTTIPTLAPIISANLTGTPTAPTVAGGDSSTKIATTAFVANVYTTLSNAYTAAVVQEASNRNSAIASAVNGLAPIANPSFTGTPTAPTPSNGDSSTNIATTAFVTSAVTTAVSTFPHITSSALPPVNGQGNNGDYWFQYV